MKTRKNYYFIFFIIGAILTSCGSTKDLVYFQNVEKFVRSSEFKKDSANYEIRIKPNDNLLITVAARNPLAAEPYNSVSLDRGGSAANLQWQGYLVDENGYINFPELGRLYVKDMTKEQLIAMLEERIKIDIEKPVVNVRFLNYKITIMGEVSKPGVYSVNDEKITLPQALALAGDLTIYGKRENVQICRINDNGEKHFQTLDLRNPAIFNSPYYYLQQNDMIYVAPNKAQASRAAYNQTWSTIISVASLLFTIGTFVYTATK